MDNAEFRPFPALVVKRISSFELVINRGSLDGIKLKDRFLVYYIDPDEIIDPETQESLGNLEIIRGTGEAIHVQEKMTTIRSDRYDNSSGKTIRRSSSPFAGITAFAGTETIEQPSKNLIEFDSARLGDKVKKY